VLLRRCVFWSLKALEARRAINILEGFALGGYILLSPYYLNFVPRWWDIYYAYSIFHNALISYGFNIVQTYHGFPLFYSFNSLLVLVAYGTANELLYLGADGLATAVVMIAMYMLVKRLLNERAAQITLLVAAGTVLYTAYILTGLDFSIVLSFFVLYLMVARGGDRRSILLGMGLIGLSTLLYHPTGAITVDLSLLLLLVLKLFMRQRVINASVILIYSAISITYTLYVAGASFEFLVGGVTSSSTNPYASFGSSTIQFSYYWFVNYLSFTIPFIFGAYFLAYALMQRREKTHLFLALFPLAFALVSLSQLLTGLGTAETTLDSFITIAVVFAVGASLDLLSKSRAPAILSLGLISLMFFTAVILPGDNLYFGKNTYPNQVPTFGTAQQGAATRILEALPSGSQTYVDSITSAWAIDSLGVIGTNIPIVVRSLADYPYEQGSYLVYSATSFPRYSVGGNPTLVFMNVTLASRFNDILYSSGDVFAVYYMA
jgi:hypothetical protein